MADHQALRDTEAFDTVGATRRTDLLVDPGSPAAAGLHGVPAASLAARHALTDAGAATAKPARRAVLPSPGWGAGLSHQPRRATLRACNTALTTCAVETRSWADCFVVPIATYIAPLHSCPQTLPTPHHTGSCASAFATDVGARLSRLPSPCCIANHWAVAIALRWDGSWLARRPYAVAADAGVGAGLLRLPHS